MSDVQVWLNEGEWFPCFSEPEAPGERDVAVTVDAATLERWRSVLQQFHAVQEEMKTTYWETYWSRGLPVE
jgi:hypothetical protein